MSELRAELKSVTERLEEADKARSLMKLEGEGSEKVVEALRAEVDKHRRAAEEAIAAATETQNELEKADADRVKAVKSLESKVGDLGAELEAVKAAKTAAESAVAEEEAARRGAEDRADDLERRVAELERNEATEREGRSGASRRVAELEDSAARMKKEMKRKTPGWQTRLNARPMPRLPREEPRPPWRTSPKSSPRLTPARRRRKIS